MTYRVTRVYIVDAQNEQAAKHTLEAWLITGLDLYPVRLEWEGVRRELDAAGGWMQELRDQLLGPRNPVREQVRKKSQS